MFVFGEEEEAKGGRGAFVCFFFLVWGERRGGGEMGEWWRVTEGKREEGRDREEEDRRLGK
jgi:hypothetical protein